MYISSELRHEIRKGLAYLYLLGAYCLAGAAGDAGRGLLILGEGCKGHGSYKAAP